MAHDILFTAIVLALIVWVLSKKPGTKEYFFTNTVAYGVCVGINISSIIINGFNFVDAVLGVIGIMLCIYNYVHYQNCNWKW